MSTGSDRLFIFHGLVMQVAITAGSTAISGMEFYNHQRGAK